MHYIWSYSPTSTSLISTPPPCPLICVLFSFFFFCKSPLNPVYGTMSWRAVDLPRATDLKRTGFLSQKPKADHGCFSVKGGNSWDPHYQNVDWIVLVQTTTIAIEFMSTEVLSYSGGTLSLPSSWLQVLL